MRLVLVRKKIIVGTAMQKGATNAFTIVWALRPVRTIIGANISNQLFIVELMIVWKRGRFKCLFAI